MKKPRERKKVGVEKRAAIRMNPQKLARQYTSLPRRPSLLRLTKSGPRPSYHHLRTKQAVNQAHPSRNYRQYIHYLHHLTNIILILVERRQGQYNPQHQLLRDKPCMVLTNLPQHFPIRFDQSRVRHTQVLLKLVNLQAILVRELSEFDSGKLNLMSAVLNMFHSSNRPTNKPGQAGGMPPNRGLPIPSSLNEAALAGKVSYTEPSKESISESGSGRQEIVRLKGQPPRPASNPTNRLPLASNHFRLSYGANLILWHYQIIVHPEIKGPKLSQVIKLALLSRTLRDLSPSIFTDFSAIILSVGEIPQQCRSFKLQYKSEVETQVSGNAKEFTISLDPIGNVNVPNPEAYMRQTDVHSSGLPVEQAFDIILGHHRKQSNEIAIINKRKAFSLTSNAGGRNLDAGVESFLVALRGYFSSIRMSQSSLLVNINVSHGAFYHTPKKLSEIIHWLRHDQNVNPGKIPGLLRGLRVRSSHIPRVWSFWGYPKTGDGRGYMLHPPRFSVADATSYTPEQIKFFHEEVKGPSQERAQNLNDKDQESAKVGKLKPHDASCSCAGKWLTVAEYFNRSKLSFCCLIR